MNSKKTRGGSVSSLFGYAVAALKKELGLQHTHTHTHNGPTAMLRMRSQGSGSETFEPRSRPHVMQLERRQAWPRSERLLPSPSERASTLGVCMLSLLLLRAAFVSSGSLVFCFLI